jgi:hypothetical protein
MCYRYRRFENLKSLDEFLAKRSSTRGGECYNEALSAVKGKIVLYSSAGPGWYADIRHDFVRNRED